MGDRQHAAAGLVFVVVQPLPEIARIVAAERRRRRIWLDHARLVATVAKDDVAVKVVALVERCPLVADESGEPARIVGLFGRIDDALPYRPVGRVAGLVGNVGREFSLRKGHDNVPRGLGAFARLDHVVPLAGLGVLHDLGFPRQEVGEKSKIVGMIRDNQEIEWTRQLYRLAA